MRSNLWASGYDVDGTDQTSLGQFSGRVQQTYKHSVPRFFVPEHGTMFTLALVRFPPTATKEIQYLNAKGALTYTDIAGRSEERFSRNAETDLVCRLLLEKKKTAHRPSAPRGETTTTPVLLRHRPHAPR